MAEQISGCHLPLPLSEAGRAKYAWNCVCWAGVRDAKCSPSKLHSRKGPQMVSSVSLVSYSNYENGNRGIPIWVVIKLSDYYKVSTDYLLSAGSNYLGSPNLRNAYLNNITLHDVLYDIQKLNSDNRKDLLRYLDYLKYINQ